MSKVIVMFLAMLAIQCVSLKTIKGDSDDKTRLSLPHLEQEETAKLHKNGTYVVSGTYHFKKDNKEYKVNYVVHEAGYDVKKYIVKDKSQYTTSSLGNHDKPNDESDEDNDDDTEDDDNNNSTPQISGQYGPPKPFSPPFEFHGQSVNFGPANIGLQNIGFPGSALRDSVHSNNPSFLGGQISALRGNYPQPPPDFYKPNQFGFNGANSPVSSGFDQSRPLSFTPPQYGSSKDRYSGYPYESNHYEPPSVYSSQPGIPNDWYSRPMFSQENSGSPKVPYPYTPSQYGFGSNHDCTSHGQYPSYQGGTDEQIAHLMAGYDINTKSPVPASGISAGGYSSAGYSSGGYSSGGYPGSAPVSYDLLNALLSG